MTAPTTKEANRMHLLSINVRLTVILSLSLGLPACTGVDIQTSSEDALKAGNYQYYDWQTVPLPENTRWTGLVYQLDPAIRATIATSLQEKGYTHSVERADFKVHYVYSPGYITGVASEQASNIHATPQPIIRSPDQASVDNAIALSGVKQTTNISISLIDVVSTATVWSATISMIVENANEMGGDAARDRLTGHVRRALNKLPDEQ
jgi:hypothetical protein